MPAFSPWLIPADWKFLLSVVRPSSRVFEYGSGGSTIHLAKQVREIVSIENDPKWEKAVREEIRRLSLTNATIVLQQHDGDGNGNDSDPHSYTSSARYYPNKKFQKYAKCIDQYPDGYFNLVIVDGRARPSCVWHAIPKTTKGGVVFLDDCYRDKYGPVIALMDGRFRRVHSGRAIAWSL